MNRRPTKALTLLAAGLATAGALMASPAQAATSTTTATETCSPWSLQSGLMTQVCASITGGSVQFLGRVALAGPPSPDFPPQQQELATTLSGQVVGGASLGSTSQYVNFLASTVTVNGPSGTVACGSTVSGTFSVTKFGWGPSPVTVNAVVPC
ncbi:hypothetical protein [Kitasatospora cheerisanensis]|uniref:Secreted protein n=1 Tax=Kitasatospora cheerisanensis KCTC 2395 TaxID=1348663 RepID=A0A066Z3R2_9ACTN|nr:hypothetical protein [Kitasatospora cheerisanensis]KDN88132.1 hypothetical protein KCH_02090 [Kitasatospora cheerisanensis KCTC 2395]